jgi:hypothetical protein
MQLFKRTKKERINYIFIKYNNLKEKKQEKYSFS